MEPSERRERRRQVSVIEGYESPFRDPIAVRAGDEVQVGRGDDAWPGWRWCSARDGRRGWVHESLFELDSSGSRASMRRDFSATELTVQPGEALTVLDEVGGWLLCEAQTGVTGWVPATHVTR